MAVEDSTITQLPADAERDSSDTGEDELQLVIPTPKAKLARPT